MNIVVVHQYYLMPEFAGGSRFNEFARIWSEAGHNVTVIAGNLDYQTGQVPSRYQGRWLTVEYDGATKVMRCNVPKVYRKGYLGRIAAFAGFTASASMAALRVKDADVVIATSPPLVAILPAWLTQLRLGKRPNLIFEVRDLMPESAVTTGVLSPRSPVTLGLYALERAAYLSAKRVNVLTPAFRADILRRRAAPAHKLIMVPNGADAEAFQPGPPQPEVRRRLGWGHRFVALYAGAHGRANALQQLVDTAAHLCNRADILIACVGDGPERQALQANAAARGLTNIMFHGAVAKSEMPAIVNAADLGLAVLQDNPTFRTVYPNKIFDYMACEKPVLLAIDGVARELVCDSARAGKFASPEDPEKFAKGVEWFADNAAAGVSMGKRGRRWVLDNATRQGLARRYIEAMQELVAAEVMS